MKLWNRNVHLGHHQGIDVLGEAFKSAVVATNGLFAAFEHKNSPFLFGLLQSPEVLQNKGTDHKGNFEKLLMPVWIRYKLQSADG